MSFMVKAIMKKWKCTIIKLQCDYCFRYRWTKWNCLKSNRMHHNNEFLPYYNLDPFCTNFFFCCRRNQSNKYLEIDVNSIKICHFCTLSKNKQNLFKISCWPVKEFCIYWPDSHPKVTFFPQMRVMISPFRQLRDLHLKLHSLSL